MYDSLSNCLGSYAVARANVQRSPWHLLTSLSVCGPKVTIVTVEKLAVIAMILMLY